jgi:hypothetical protein
VVFHNYPPEYRISGNRPQHESQETVGVRHVLELEMGRLREVLDNIQSLDAKKNEREKQNVNELDSEKEGTQ